MKSEKQKLFFMAAVCYVPDVAVRIMPLCALHSSNLFLKG
jgi:hypothetical protein